MEAQTAAKLEPFVLVAKGSRGAATAKAIEQATAAPGVFVFSELLQLPSVQELATHETYASWFSLLQLFAYGTFEDYRASPNKFPPLNGQQITKLKHLSIVSLGSVSRTLPYETLLTTLDIAGVRSLEDLLIEAIFLQAIRGKMDQRRGCFLVDEVLGRDLSERALADVGQQLADWATIQQTLVNNLSTTITLAQSSAGQHQSQLLAYQVAKDAALAEAAKGPTGTVAPPQAQAGQEGLGFHRDESMASKPKGKKPPAREASSQAHQRKRNRN